MASHKSGELTICGAGIDFDSDITLGAVKALRRCDSLVYIHKDRARLQALLDEYLRPGARTLFPGGGRGSAWRAVSGELARGRRVVYLTYGHPAIFSEGRELEQACRAAGYRVSVLPGVSSADSLLAALPSLGIPDDGQGFCVTSAAAFAAGGQPAPAVPLLLFCLEDPLRYGGNALFKALLSAYPPGHKAYLLRSADVMGPLHMARLRLADLKDNPGLAGHRMTLLIPPCAGKAARTKVRRH